ncbi:hypothetical protein J7898_04560 [Vibrio parahaemolyticus]|nr:RNA-dependent DNA polymerase [Vibrio parahaemolyticus]MCF9560160.1 hypothetical protein [Vibrio parahaemolyticus]
MNGIERIKKIHELNAKNPKWVNRDLYKLLLKEDVLITAYEMMKSKDGNMTKGITNGNIDGFSLTKVDTLIRRLKDESFAFSPARRVEIPKANGKTRPLGIAPPTEKVVQYGMKMILEAIFEPTFSDDSHGFRPKRGCHSALQNVRHTWTGVTWIVEGDIKSFFDEIDHHKLIDILRTRIDDEKFINLVWKALRAGFVLNGTFHATDKGTPQGSIVSPMLANIYLDVFDQKVNDWKEEYAQGHQSRAPESKEYKMYQQRIRNARIAIRKIDDGTAKKIPKGRTRPELVKKIREWKQIQTRTPARAGGWFRLKYIRYADDWMIGVIGDKRLAERIRSEAETFLANELKLTLSLEKTHITHGRTELAKFLGTTIKISAGEIQKVVMKGTPTIRRTGVGKPILKIPMKDILDRLAKKGFCTPNTYEPIHFPSWQNFDDWEIINRYNAMFRGIYNYYCFSANKYKLARVLYILHFSCAKTLCGKHRIKSVKKLMKKRGRLLATSRVVKGETKWIKLYKPKSMKTTPDEFLTERDPRGMDDLFNTYFNRRSKSKLGYNCAICDSDDRVQMHHVRHIRKMGDKVKGFTKIMASVNRKQIPVCHECHWHVHRGNYDGISLKQLANPEYWA